MESWFLRVFRTRISISDAYGSLTMLADCQVMNDDFYKYVKSDTLKGLNWICGDEGSAACNGGGLPPTCNFHT